jgi:hypothetical protein
MIIFIFKEIKKIENSTAFPVLIGGLAGIHILYSVVLGV